MKRSDLDPIEEFYGAHPYPPPVTELPTGGSAADGRARAFAHHLIWPARPPGDIASTLIAGCGTSQAARHAARNPATRVVGIDVSATSIDHTRQLAERHGLTNLEARQMPIEAVDELGERFDHVVCTGVLHHLADPELGLRHLAAVLAPGGAITLMVYAPYGRAGVYLMQEYCRRLGVNPSEDEISDLVEVLSEMPDGHPLRRLLRESPDFQDDDALADALLNPRDRSYSVPALLELLESAGLRFGRWVRQAPYLPDCGAMSETPHAARIADLAVVDQFAAMELFRGTMVRHTAVAFRADEPGAGRLDFSDPQARRWRPLPAPTAIAVEERLPAGAVAALINRSHTDTDLVMFVDRRELRMFNRIDGDRPIAELGAGAAPFVERLFRHDLVVVDATEVGS